MSTSIAATQHKPRALHRYTPATTNYVELLYNGAALPDWITAIRIRSGAPVRVAHWGVADGDAIGTVSEYEDLGAIGGGVILRRGGLRVFVSGITSVPVEFVAAGFGVDLGMAPYVVPTSGLLPVLLDDVAFTYDPNSELVSVSEADGVWTVEIDMATALTEAHTGACWIFPLKDVYGRTALNTDTITSWSTTVQTDTAPTKGSGVCIMSGRGAYSAGLLAGNTKWAGLSYGDATYTRGRAQQSATIVTSGQASDTAVDRVYGMTCGRTAGRIDVSTFAFQVAAGDPTDLRPSSSDSNPGGQAIATSNQANTAQQYGMISVFSTAAGTNETISFRVAQKATFEERQA